MENSNHVLLNEELNLYWPDGFSVMTEEEQKAAFKTESTDRFGLHDKERHIIVFVWWHLSNPLIVKLAGSIENVVKQTEKKLSKTYKNHNYQFGGFFSTEVCGCSARGLRYDYTLGDIVQTCETIQFIYKSCCYTVSCYTRPELIEENHPILEKILQDMEITEEE